MSPTHYQRTSIETVELTDLFGKKEDIPELINNTEPLRMNVRELYSCLITKKGTGKMLPIAAFMITVKKVLSEYPKEEGEKGVDAINIRDKIVITAAFVQSIVKAINERIEDIWNNSQEYQESPIKDNQSSKYKTTEYQGKIFIDITELQKRKEELQSLIDMLHDGLTWREQYVRAARIWNERNPGCEIPKGTMGPISVFHVYLGTTPHNDGIARDGVEKILGITFRDIAKVESSDTIDDALSGRTAEDNILSPSISTNTQPNYQPNPLVQTSTEVAIRLPIQDTERRKFLSFVEDKIKNVESSARKKIYQDFLTHKANVDISKQGVVVSEIGERKFRAMDEDVIEVIRSIVNGFNTKMGSSI